MHPLQYTMICGATLEAGCHLEQELYIPTQQSKNLIQKAQLNVNFLVLMTSYHKLCGQNIFWNNRYIKYQPLSTRITKVPLNLKKTVKCLVVNELDISTYDMFSSLIKLKMARLSQNIAQQKIWLLISTQSHYKANYFINLEIKFQVWPRWMILISIRTTGVC